MLLSFYVIVCWTMLMSVFSNSIFLVQAECLCSNWNISCKYTQKWSQILVLLVLFMCAVIFLQDWIERLLRISSMGNQQSKTKVRGNTKLFPYVRVSSSPPPSQSQPLLASDEHSKTSNSNLTCRMVIVFYFNVSIMPASGMKLKFTLSCSALKILKRRLKLCVNRSLIWLKK